MKSSGCYSLGPRLLSKMSQVIDPATTRMLPGQRAACSGGVASVRLAASISNVRAVQISYDGKDYETKGTYDDGGCSVTHFVLRVRATNCTGTGCPVRREKAMSGFAVQVVRQRKIRAETTNLRVIKAHLRVTKGAFLADGIPTLSWSKLRPPAADHLDSRQLGHPGLRSSHRLRGSIVGCLVTYARLS